MRFHPPARYVPLTLAVVALLHSGLVLHAAWVKSLTIDEQAHLPAALAHVTLGRLELYRVNPPLATLPAGLALAGLRAETDWRDYTFNGQMRDEFTVGGAFAHLNAARLQSLQFWARAACLPWTLLGLGVCFLWGQALYGDAGGLLAAALWAFCPETVAHAALVTPDLAGAATGLLAGFAFWRWAGRYETGTVAAGRTLTLGLTLGLTLLCKFTWVLLPPLWLLLAVVWFWRDGPRVLVTRLGQLVLAGCVALLVLNAGYGFEETGRPLREFEFSSLPLAGHDTQAPFAQPGNWLAGTWAGRLPVPVPANVLRGIDLQKASFEAEGLSYMAGRWATHGWWYYYLYAAAVKLPLGLWLLGVLAVACGRFRKQEWLVVAPAAAVFLFVSSETGFSRHFRYVLPALPFLFVFCGRLVGGPAAVTARRGKVMIAAATGWLIAACLWIHPHQLSYFNELAGGPANGPRHLVNSNIDWGQDLWLLRDWLTKHQRGRPVGIASYGGLVRPEWFGIGDGTRPPALFPADPLTDLPPQGPGPRPGLYAVSVNALMARPLWVTDGAGVRRDLSETRYAYFAEQFQPIARAGYSIYIYDLSAQEVAAARQRMGLPALSKERLDQPRAARL